MVLIVLVTIEPRCKKKSVINFEQYLSTQWHICSSRAFETRGVILTSIQSQRGEKIEMWLFTPSLSHRKLGDTQGNYLVLDLNCPPKKYFIDDSWLTPLLQNAMKTQSMKGINKEIVTHRIFHVALQMRVLRQPLTLHVPTQVKGYPKSDSAHPCLSDPFGVLLLCLEHFSIFSSLNKAQSSFISKPDPSFISHPPKNSLSITSSSNQSFRRNSFPQKAKRVDAHISLIAQK